VVEVVELLVQLILYMVEEVEVEREVLELDVLIEFVEIQVIQ
jgi:hypothetical protein